MKILIKYTIPFFALLCIMSFEKAGDDTSTLYVIALKQHILKIEKNATSQSEKKDFPNKTIFVINECGIELPKEIGSHKLQELGDSAKVFINDDTGLHAIKLNPIEVKKGKIIIILSDYIVSKSDTEAKFSYAGGIEYIFNYSYKSQRYELLRTETISF